MSGLKNLKRVFTAGGSREYSHDTLKALIAFLERLLEETDDGYLGGVDGPNKVTAMEK